MNLIQQYNQTIHHQFRTYLNEAQIAFQAISDKVNPLFLKAVEKLNQLNYDTIKAEMTAQLIESCQNWLNDEAYKNIPMDAILFEHDYTYSENIEALAYGIDGDLSGFDYDFLNGIEAHDGIQLKPFNLLSFIDKDYSTLSKAIGFNELNNLFGSYVHLLVQEVFTAFAQSDIFKKIARKPVFFMALGEHDMDEIRLYFVCDDEVVFKKYLDDFEAELAGIESEKVIEKKYSKLKYHVSELLDILVFSNDDTQIAVILDGLQELIDNSPKHKYWAMMKLGKLYMIGSGVELNLNKARYYFETAIENGQNFEKRQSYLMLASMYYDGKGVVKNLFKAQQFITTAHEISVLGGRFLDLKKQIEKDIRELNN